jgi:hypothetical protein
MDAFQLLEETGVVPPANDATIEGVVEVVLRAALEEGRPLPASFPSLKRRRRLVVGAMAVATTAVAVAVVAIVVPADHSPGSKTARPSTIHPGHVAPALLTATTVRLISLQSQAATADSGTATETETNMVGSSLQGSPATINVTFSGQNVNYLITSNGNGAEGVENRVVDGQLYLYIKGSDLQMHWYHDTTANAAGALSFPDPRSLLEAVSPSAGLENLGQESVGGVELTHLRATTPGPIGKLGLPDVGGTVTSFDVWVDRDSVVRKLTVSSSAGTGITCSALQRPTSAPPVTTNLNAETPSGTKVGASCTTTTLSSTIDVQFAHLGVPETITAPSDAIDQQGLG